MSKWHIALLQPQATQLKQDDDDLWDSGVAKVLRARGYEVYYPAIPRRTHRTHRIIRMHMQPMFPGYMLIKESGCGWEALRTAPGIRVYHSLLINPTTGRLAKLSQDEIWRIAETERRLIDQAINPPPRVLPYAIGDRVKVIDGAFADRYATIETLDDEERIALLLDIFGRPTRVFASHEHLAVLSP